MPFAAEFLAFLRAHAGQQAEVVLLHRELPAAGLEFALGAVPVQTRSGGVGLANSAVILPRRFRTSPARAGVFTLSVAWSSPWMILPEADGASEHFGEHKCIERQQQLVVLGELVAVDETDGNELRWLAPAGGRNAFDGVRRDCSADVPSASWPGVPPGVPTGSGTLPKPAGEDACATMFTANRHLADFKFSTSGEVARSPFDNSAVNLAVSWLRYEFSCVLTHSA